MPDVRSILDPLQIPDSVKADAWDAYTQAKTTDELKARLDKLPLANGARADLWDAKHAQTEGDYPLFSRIPGFSAVKPAFDAAAGAGGAFAQHAINAYDLIRKIPGADKILPDSSELHRAIADATPENTPAHVGRFLEGVGEFMYPAAKAEELTQGAGLVARMAAQGGVAGGVSAVQSGGDPNATATGAALGAAGPLLGAAGEAVAPTAKRVVAQVLGRTTGAGPAAIEQAIENPSAELVSAMRGKTNQTDVLEGFKQALQNVKDARSAEYQARFAQLPQNMTLDPAPVRAEASRMLESFGVDQNPGGLDFDRSTITDPKAQKQVREIIGDLDDWGSRTGDLTPAMVDTLKRRISNRFTDDSQASAFIASVASHTGDLLKANVPGYAEMTKGYENASRFLDSLRDLSLEGKNPATALSKLTTALNDNHQYRQGLTDALGQFTNVDLKGHLAGLKLAGASPGGLTGAIDLGSGIGLIAGIARGVIDPKMAVTLAAASPRLMGELVVAMSKAAPAIKAAAPAIGAIAPAVANETLNAPK